MHCISPRANAGFSMLAASSEPGAEPAPMMVWISSMKTMISLCFFTSSMSLRTRSSNCPLNCVPATRVAMFSVTMRLFSKGTGTFLVAMSCAIPSTTAVFPTPGSPMSTGLFFFLRQSICITRSISVCLPTTGSNAPCSASEVRSVQNLSMMGVCDFSAMRVVVFSAEEEDCSFSPLGAPGSSSSKSKLPNGVEERKL